MAEPPGDLHSPAASSSANGVPLSLADSGAGDGTTLPGAQDAAPVISSLAAQARIGRHRDFPQTYAAIDLGTNNCRLLVARPTRRGFMVIDAFSRIIRLGEGVTATGVLSEVAMRRTIEALLVCAEKMRRRGVKRSRLIATEACRIAQNGVEFVDRVRRETGLALEIVNPETEARLAVSGCASLLDRNADWALVFDIGGGSSELILLDLRRKRRNGDGTREAASCIAAWTSLPFGVVTLSERYGGRDVDETLYARMVDEVSAHVVTFERSSQIKERIGSGRVQLLGTSGTVTTIAGIHLGLKIYDRSRVDGLWVRTAHACAVSRRLLAMSYAERASQACIGPDRADLVLSGCAILEALLRHWSSDRLRVADRGLREGILTALMAEDGHERRFGHTRRGRA